jgi:hypothetical protein
MEEPDGPFRWRIPSRLYFEFKPLMLASPMRRSHASNERPVFALETHAMILHFVREIADLLPGWSTATSLLTMRREASAGGRRRGRTRHISISPVSAEWMLEHEKACSKDGQ